MRSSIHRLAALVALSVLPSCGGGDDDPNAEAGYAEADIPAVKYEEAPVDPLDLNLAADAMLAARATVELSEGAFARYVFQKQAGKRYTVALTGLSADLDLFGHWVRDVSRRNHQFVSWRYGTHDEQFDFTASEDGPYYVLVHGYQAGQASLELYISDARAEDEVGWPVEWGADDKTARQMVGGGLEFLEVYDYGRGCGRTPHPGYDLNFGAGAADLGEPVLAVADGVVVDSFLASWGNLVRLQHRLADGLEFWSLYGHLDERYVRVGETVRRGQTIATVGSTGTGSPHLHFELRKASFAAAEFPCGRTEWQVRANYYDPGEFIRNH